MPAVRKRSTWSNIMISTLGGLLHFGQQRGYGYSAQSPYQTTAHPRRASVPITQFSQSAQTLAKNQDHRCRRCRTHCRRYDQSAAWSASTEIVFFLSFFSLPEMANNECLYRFRCSYCFCWLLNPACTNPALT